MEEDDEKVTAAQGLLDIALKSSQTTSVDGRGSTPRRAEPRFSLSGRESLREARNSSPTRIPAFRPVPPRGPLLNSGRVITSGNAPPVVKPKEDSASGFKPPESRNKEKQFFQPKPRRPEPQERVTLIVSKKSAEENEAEQQIEERDRKSSFDLPVPPSAFAATGRISAESVGPRAQLSDLRETDAHSGSDEENRKRGMWGNKKGQPSAKKSKLDRTVSISTALQQVDEQDHRLDHDPGRTSKTLQELVPWSEHQKRRRDAISTGPANTMEIAQRLWGGPPEPVHREPHYKDAQRLMPRNSSDKSTLELHKQLAQQCSGETITNYLPVLRHGNGEAAERDQAIGQYPSVLSAQTLIGSAPLPSDAADDKLPPASSALNIETSPKETVQNVAAQEATANDQTEEDNGTQIWTGQVKHRLKTPDGATSVADLFRVHAQVPAKLMEQLPPTIFINVIVGRAQVKLGKHYVANCQLVNPTEEEIQKATALANRKLVAICELQHCTITLVPHFIAEHSFRLVAFLIADE